MNITFTTLGNGTVTCTSGDRTIVAFPEDNKPVADALVTLLPVPEDEPPVGTVSWPGEYDFNEVAIRGVGHEEGKYVSYVIEMEGARIAFIALPLHDWPDAEIEALGDVDVLVMPAGNHKFAQKLIDEIDPRVIMPVAGEGDDEYAELLKLTGGDKVEAASEYKMRSLPAEGREVVVLK